MCTLIYIFFWIMMLVLLRSKNVQGTFTYLKTKVHLFAITSCYIIFHHHLKNVLMTLLFVKLHCFAYFRLIPSTNRPLYNGLGVLMVQVSFAVITMQIITYIFNGN